MTDEVAEIKREADRAAVVRIARSLRDVRFRHQGRSRELGIDCFGLPFVVAVEMGWHYPDYHTYSRHPNWHQAFGYLDRHLPRVPVADLQIGDIALLDHGCPHGAIIVDGAVGLNIVHSSAIQRRVIENRFTEKPRALYRFRELA